MKIGIITNLQNIDKFVSTELAFANSERWMAATGGNTGNVAFVQGIKNIITAEKVGEVHWGDNPEAVNEYYDLLIICCANQIGAHVDLGSWADRLTAFNLPTLFIGLGAQSNSIGEHPDVPEGTIRLLELSKKLRTKPDVPNIITRGPFTTEVLEKLGVESLPYGCPSQFISTELNIGKKCLKHQETAQHFRVLTAAGNPWHASYTLEKTLVEIVNEYKGDYVLQHPVSLVQLALAEGEVIEDNQRERLEKIYGFMGSWETICDWFRSHGVLFADAQNWMLYSKRFTLAIGPRYHGVALPIQAGVPGKVIAIDSRTEELSDTTGIPFVRYKEIEKLSKEELVDWCKWSEEDANKYDLIRKNNAESYSEFLTKNLVSPSLNLTGLASQ
tara:strand:- start:1744 stop:2904 length:1161 start_codon:yes stop_codon:yes gene_type:complete